MKAATAQAALMMNYVVSYRPGRVEWIPAAMFNRRDDADKYAATFTIADNVEEVKVTDLNAEEKR